MPSTQPRRLGPSLMAFTAIALLTTAAAATQISLAQASPGQDPATTALETRNARAAERRGLLSRPGIDYHANALARCSIFKDSDDKSACEARVNGAGKVSGSVAGGGLLRELETVVPATQTR